MACRKGEAIVLRSAEKTMGDLNFTSKPKILSFIGSGGLENPVFVRCAVWENNPDPNIQIMVDSYDFNSGPTTYAYLAFMFQPKTKRWLIKSLKKNKQTDPSPHILLEAFKKAGLLE